MSNDATRNSIRVLVDEIVTAHDQLALPVDVDELAEARAIIDRIERRMKASAPLPQPDPKQFADFADEAP